MIKPLNKSLQEKQETLESFYELTQKVLQYIPNVVSREKKKRGYVIYSSNQAGSQKHIRPIRESLYLNSPNTFQDRYNDFKIILRRLKTGGRQFSESELKIIDQVVYTIQQSIGAGLDLTVNPNAARKHVGNRFEELISVLFTEIGITNKGLVLQIPYETEEGQKMYKCENDLIVSPYDEIRSSVSSLDEKEVVVSIKTTSKDRMGKMFIDKLLLERFVGHSQKVIGIFLNDVQRKGEDNISFTLVSGLFMVYTRFLTPLEGIYYLDPPPNATLEPYKAHMSTFSRLITRDIFDLLTS